MVQLTHSTPPLPSPPPPTAAVLEAEIAKVRSGGTALTEADLQRISKSNEVMGRMRQLHQHIVHRERGKRKAEAEDRAGGGSWLAGCTCWGWLAGCRGWRWVGLPGRGCCLLRQGMVVPEFK
jgi:hypothetical protein